MAPTNRFMIRPRATWYGPREHPLQERERERIPGGSSRTETTIETKGAIEAIKYEARIKNMNEEHYASDNIR